MGCKLLLLVLLVNTMYPSQPTFHYGYEIVNTYENALLLALDKSDIKIGRKLFTVQKDALLDVFAFTSSTIGLQYDEYRNISLFIYDDDRYYSIPLCDKMMLKPYNNVIVGPWSCVKSTNGLLLSWIEQLVTVHDGKHIAKLGTRDLMTCMKNDPSNFSWIYRLRMFDELGSRVTTYSIDFDLYHDQDITAHRMCIAPNGSAIAIDTANGILVKNIDQKGNCYNLLNDIKVKKLIHWNSSDELLVGYNANNGIRLTKLLRRGDSWIEQLFIILNLVHCNGDIHFACNADIINWTTPIKMSDTIYLIGYYIPTKKNIIIICEKNKISYLEEIKNVSFYMDNDGTHMLVELFDSSTMIVDIVIKDMKNALYVDINDIANCIDR